MRKSQIFKCCLSCCCHDEYGFTMFAMNSWSTEHPFKVEPFRNGYVALIVSSWLAIVSAVYQQNVSRSTNIYGGMSYSEAG